MKKVIQFVPNYVVKFLPIWQTAFQLYCVLLEYEHIDNRCVVDMGVDFVPRTHSEMVAARIKISVKARRNGGGGGTTTPPSIHTHTYTLYEVLHAILESWQYKM